MKLQSLVKYRYAWIVHTFVNDATWNVLTYHRDYKELMQLGVSFSFLFEVYSTNNLVNKYK